MKIISILALGSMFLVAKTGLASDDFKCEIPNYMMDLSSADPENAPRFTFSLSISEEAGNLKGFLAMSSNPPHSISLDVFKKQSAYVVGAEKLYDQAIDKLGYSERLKSIVTYSFGKSTNRGIAALLLRLKDESGNDIDQLAYSYMGPGFASCATKQIVFFDFKNP